MVNQKAPCSRSTCRGIRLRDALTLVLRSYGQPAEFPWHILGIFPYHKTVKKIKNTEKSFFLPTADHSHRSFASIQKIFECYSHARNKRFQLPVIPKANQILWHCSNSQSALRPKSGRSEHKLVRLSIRPNFSVTT